MHRFIYLFNLKRMRQTRNILIYIISLFLILKKIQEDQKRL